MSDKKVIFITGASSGLGAQVAREFARRGYRIALLARRTDRLAQLAGELEKSGTETIALAADVTEPDALAKAVAATVERWGRIDIVLANAGFAVNGPLHMLTVADYRRQFETNVWGVVNTVYATREALIASGGILALMGSIAGRLPMPNNTAYGMSKAAVRALALGLREEMAKKGVSVVLLSPGFIDTEITHVTNDGVTHAESVKKMPPALTVPLARGGAEVARAILSRKREVVVTGHGKVLVALNHNFPGIYRQLARRLK